jgi:hypothetical protein
MIEIALQAAVVSDHEHRSLLPAWYPAAWDCIWCDVREPAAAAGGRCAWTEGRFHGGGGLLLIAGVGQHSTAQHSTAQHSTRSRVEYYSLYYQRGRLSNLSSKSNQFSLAVSIAIIMQLATRNQQVQVSAAAVE